MGFISYCMSLSLYIMSYFFSDIWVLYRQLDLFILQWEEVLCSGFDLTVLDPSDRKGNDTYCIVAIEDKKMGFISYCLSLSLYIMSSSLMRYSVLVNLIL